VFERPSHTCIGAVGSVVGISIGSVVGIYLGSVVRMGIGILVRNVVRSVVFVWD
jgi:hypothetical protein